MRVESIDAWPARAWVASRAIPASRRGVKQVWRSWWQPDWASPARPRAPSRISSSPAADSGSPRRRPFNTTNSCVLVDSGGRSCSVSRRRTRRTERTPAPPVADRPSPRSRTGGVRRRLTSPMWKPSSRARGRQHSEDRSPSPASPSRRTGTYGRRHPGMDRRSLERQSAPATCPRGRRPVVPVDRRQLPRAARRQRSKSRARFGREYVIVLDDGWLPTELAAQEKRRYVRLSADRRPRYRAANWKVNPHQHWEGARSLRRWCALLRCHAL